MYDRSPLTLLLVGDAVGALGLHEMGGFTGPVLITKWFVRFRGRAMGLATLGTTVGGMVMAPILGFLIPTVGWRETWRLMGIAVIRLRASSTK